MNQYVTGAVIKRLREEKNMTQQQLADKEAFDREFPYMEKKKLPGQIF